MYHVVRFYTKFQGDDSSKSWIFQNILSKNSSCYISGTLPLVGVIISRFQVVILMNGLSTANTWRFVGMRRSCVTSFYNLKKFREHVQMSQRYGWLLLEVEPYPLKQYILIESESNIDDNWPDVMDIWPTKNVRPLWIHHAMLNVVWIEQNLSV